MAWNFITSSAIKMFLVRFVVSQKRKEIPFLPDVRIRSYLQLRCIGCSLYLRNLSLRAHIESCSFATLPL